MSEETTWNAFDQMESEPVMHSDECKSYIVANDASILFCQRKGEPGHVDHKAIMERDYGYEPIAITWRS